MGLAPEVEYELAIDSQVEAFLELKQKLAYFLITASVVVIGFVTSFVVSNLRVREHFVISDLELALVIVSAIVGLGAAGCSLFNIHLEHRSHRLHLRYRYLKRSWCDLSDSEQKKWLRVNDVAGRLLRGAFVCLFVEIALAVAFFVVFFV